MLKHMINPAGPGYPLQSPPSRQLHRLQQVESNGDINHSRLNGYAAGSVATPTAHRLSSCRQSTAINLQSPKTPLSMVSNGGLHIARDTPASVSVTPGLSTETVHKEPGVREMLTSLGLLCLISLLLALLSLIFLLKISPVSPNDVIPPSDSFPTVLSPDEYIVVYEVTLALCALSLSLNLCCLLVCSVQFLFAVKLVRDSPDGERTNKYLKKSSVTRVCAVGGFFVSIPVFLTGLILYTFIQFHSTPAILTSGLIGFGIVFCGCAMVHNVFVWQKEKTDAVRALAQKQREQQQQQQQVQQQHHNISSIQHGGGHLGTTPNHVVDSFHHQSANYSHNLTSSHSVLSSPHLLAGNSQHSILAREASGSVSPGPHATIDLSSVATTPHELSTLV